MVSKIMSRLILIPKSHNCTSILKGIFAFKIVREEKIHMNLFASSGVSEPERVNALVFILLARIYF